MYPDFLVIGAQKAGTTWLYVKFKLHPEIWLTPEKEICYFNNITLNQNTKSDVVSHNRNGKKTFWVKRIIKFLTIRNIEIIKSRKFKRCMLRDLRNLSFRNLIWDMRYFFGRKNDKWYASLFKPGRGKKTGDIDPTYSVVSEDVIKYIYDMAPNLKVVFIMRNPIERAWSHAKMAFKKKIGVFAKTKGLLEDIPDDLFIQHFENRDSRKQGNYIQTLKNWQRYFPEDQIFIAFTDDIAIRPRELLCDIYKFLEVDSSFEIPVESLKEKVLAGNSYSIPDSIGRFLAQMYYPEIKQLCEMFSGHQAGYVLKWSAFADSLLKKVKN